MAPEEASAGAPALKAAGWRSALKRDVALLLLAKLAALALLWWLFFSPTHQVRVDAPATGSHLAVQPAAAPGGSRP